MSDYVPLNRQMHERLRLGPTLNYDRFRETTLVPIIVDEIALVAREYPIIFPESGNGSPYALTGMQINTNAFVDKDGKWKADYIPMDVGRYPFGLTEVSDSKDTAGNTRYTLCVDPTSHEFTDLEGVLVFQPDGELAPAAKKKADLAHKLLARSALTKVMIKGIEDAGLLVPRSIKLNLGLETRQIQGFRVVDEKKLNSMSDEEIVLLRNKGLLPLIYAQLMSMANFRLGPLAGQINPIPADVGSNQVANKLSDDALDLSLFAKEDDFDIFH